MPTLVITNNTAAEKLYLGLPAGGKIAAGATETFVVAEAMLEGAFGCISPLELLIADEAAGDIAVEISGTGILNTWSRVIRKRFVVGHADLTAEDPEEILTLGQLPAGAFLLGGQINVTAAFAGGAVSAIVMDLGITGAATLGAANANAAAVAKTAVLQPMCKDIGEIDILATFTATDDDVVNLTAGAVTIDLYYVYVPT